MNWGSLVGLVVAMVGMVVYVLAGPMIGVGRALVVGTLLMLLGTGIFVFAPDDHDPGDGW